MVTQLKAKDIPEPWLATKKAKPTMSRQKATVTESSVLAESNVNTMVDEGSRRGRGRPPVQVKVADALKGKKKAKSLTTSAVDVVLGRSKTVVPDVDDLRRRREADSLACRRQVRNIFEPSNKRIMTSNTMTRATDANNLHWKKDVAAATLSVKPCTLQSKEKVEDDGAIAVEEEEDIVQQISVDHCGKETMADEMHEAGRVSERIHSTVRRELWDADVRNHFDDEEDSISNRKRCVSPKRIVDNRYQGREGQRSEAYEDGQPSHRRGHEPFYSTSPLQISSRNSHMQDYRSRRRSRSRSPPLGKEGRQQGILQQLPEYDNGPKYAEHFEHEYRTPRSFSNGERRHSRKYYSSSPEKDSHQRRSPSPLDARKPRRRSGTPNWSRSPPRISRDARDAQHAQRMGLSSVKQEDMTGTCGALGRKQRQHEQSYREDDMAMRQREGMKPFYMTLDPEGKPYGPGKPSWIAEISKLAAGLDPSCTHIRKQTFEDVQTFKDRLDEHFEYSGKLNEDHLRGLMGKAVTKRRGELISFIKNNGKQPSSIDIRVWRRLEKLAYSKQREDKSKQGRYANACRKTLGRTGAGGVNGVRERLRIMLRRSPHPEEVEEELLRDKGFGGQKRKPLLLSCTGQENIAEVILSDEDLHSQSLQEGSDGHFSDVSRGQQYRRQPRSISKEIGICDEDNAHSEDACVERIAIGYRSSVVPLVENLARDEYIETLKAEIKRLQAGNGIASSAATFMPSLSVVSTPSCVKEGLKRNLEKYEEQGCTSKGSGHCHATTNEDEDYFEEDLC